MKGFATPEDTITPRHTLTFSFIGPIIPRILDLSRTGVQRGRPRRTVTSVTDVPSNKRIGAYVTRLDRGFIQSDPVSVKYVDNAESEASSVGFEEPVGPGVT